MTQQFHFKAIGTDWKINYRFQGQSLEMIKIQQDIQERAEQFDKNYSRFRGDSLVSRWRQKAGQHELPSDGTAMIGFYKKLYDATDGLITPLIGQTLEQAGYDANYSLQPKKLTSPPPWVTALEFPRPGPGNRKNVAKYTLEVKQPVLLDFGAAGKGYLVDLIGQLLVESGIKQFCINAGGDIYTHHLAQTIGLEDPDNQDVILGEINMSSGALCASAGNRRKWDEYHHIINPRSLKSENLVKATWVKADTTMLADGLATALFLVSPEKLLQTFAFEYAIISGQDLLYSDNFKAKFYEAAAP